MSDLDGVGERGRGEPPARGLQPVVPAAASRGAADAGSQENRRVVAAEPVPSAGNSPPAAAVARPAALPDPA